MAADFKNLVSFILFVVVYLIFSLWIWNLIKLHFTNLANQKNLNQSVQIFVCEIHLVFTLLINKAIFSFIFGKKYNQ